MSAARRSGLQKEVLGLYRRALRIPRTKPEQTREKWDLLIRYTFRRNAMSVFPRDVSAIEHLLRVGGRQITAYEAESVKDCQVSAEMRLWDQRQRQKRTFDQ
ncbi:Heat shock [Mycena venus]|uniref:Heat shock n=1 Tax=Mycena venus TaxID=2733690 RepID=A0A8H7D7K5_9AGAR|nr:Heat shock [Mycena venus]